MNRPKIRLLADRVLVEVIDDKGTETKTASGIIIPSFADQSEEKPQKGVVIRVSARVSKCEVEEDKVYEGEEVIFSKFAGSPITFEGVDYKLLRITDLFGAMETTEEA